MSNDDVFITSIHVKKVRNLENFDIPLSEEKRQHLIITGKNGSGKTSLLLEMDKFVKQTLISQPNNYLLVTNGLKDSLELLAVMHETNKQKLSFESNVRHFQSVISSYGETKISFKHPHLITTNYLYVFFESKRINQPTLPNGITKVELKNVSANSKLNTYFIQHIVNLKAERSFAKDDNDNEAVKRIDNWFERFENQLRILFDAPDLRLIFDRQNYNFHIQIGNNEPFAFNELSDGYSAVISIVTELILRMEATGNKAYNQQGIVLIDEIETHLHVALQKKIMPFLCDFFPNVQFIVTTHSPFVLSSISDAVICDLETKEVITDLSGYSYTALVESYFDTDKYSQKIKNKISRFEELSTKEVLDEQEEDERDELKHYFNNLPKFYADELEVKLQQIRLQTMARKG
jgi:predicted ATP-binding protein involved in virulence